MYGKQGMVYGILETVSNAWHVEGMVYGVSDVWHMVVFGLLHMLYGIWIMVYGVWYVVYGIYVFCHIAYGI